MAKVYELKMNPEMDSDVHTISLVEKPAIQIDFMTFSKEEIVEDVFKFSLNEERKELMGAAMIPEMRIKKIDKHTKEIIEVFFSAETIRQIAQNYFRNGYQHNTSIEHSGIPADSYVFQSYIVDSEKGIMSPKGMDLPDGSWVVGVKVESNNVWQNIKAGKMKGFSIEISNAERELKFSSQDEQFYDRNYNTLDELKAINERLSKMK